jgi:hypothetical protein
VPVDHDRNLLFIHIPKTGGTTILTSLGLWQSQRSANLRTLFGDFGGIDLQHLTLSQAEQFLTPAEFAQYYKFSFVRNPWDRAVSAALWQGRFPDEGIRDLRDYIGWAERVNRIGARRAYDAHALPQSAFVTTPNGSVGVDHIGRFENFARDLQRILGRFVKLSHPLPQNLRRDDRRDYREFYGGDLQGRVAALYAEDVARFGYAF